MFEVRQDGRAQRLVQEKFDLTLVEALHTELSGLLEHHPSAYRDALSIRAAVARADALTILCRTLLRESTVCYIDGELVCFNGRYYEKITYNQVYLTISNLLMDHNASPYDIRRMGEMPLSVLSMKTHPRSTLLAFTNGVLDLSNMRWTEGFSPALYVTESLPYDYIPTALCPKWEKFLSEVLPDESLRNILQEFFGMVYLDRSGISVEKFAIFVGRGANGKSVIFEVMKRVFGASNVTTLDSLQLADEKMLPYVKNARLNFAPDLSVNKDFSSALKALASGQDVTARRIYGEAEKIKCPPLCFAMNEFPRFKDVTDGFFRRILLISFDVQIPPHRQDKRLVERICASDLPGIMNWVLQGRFRLLRNGGEFSVSEKMNYDLDTLRGRVVSRSDSPVRTFLEMRGYSVYPAYSGQLPMAFPKNEILDGLHGTVTATGITRELASYGVKFINGRTAYGVYPKHELPKKK